MNGTWINGDELAPGTSRDLQDGDKLTLGPSIDSLFLLPASLHRKLCERGSG